jgi:WD40 repeat protein
LLEPGTEPKEVSTSIMVRFPTLRREALVRPLPLIPGFEIVEEIGRGSSGIVYKAREESNGRLVAIKVIQSGPYASSKNFSWLHAQLKAVARLQHPCVLQLYQVGEQDGRPFLVMEYVDGGNLRQKIGGRPQPASQAAQLVETLARTLHYAEQQGIGHRDLKPSNILLTSDGVPKVADFGMVRGGEQPAGSSNGLPLLYPGYLAPEQLLDRQDGQAPAPIGVPADIYALGAVLYEMLTGRPPLLGTTPAETQELVRTEEPIPPSRLQLKVSPVLEAICLRCLEKEPAKRYADAEALAEDLRRFLAGQPTVVRPPNRWQRGWRWARRRQGQAILLAVGALAIVSLVAGAMWSRSRMSRERQAANTEREQAWQAVRQGAHYLYLADMNLAQQAWEQGDAQRCLDLLEKHRPAAGADDPRSFEWAYLWRLCHSNRQTLRAHPVRAHAVAFAADGAVLATGGDGPLEDGKPAGLVKLWDPATGKEGITLKGHRTPVLAVAFAASGHLLASAGRDGLIKVWDAQSGKELRTLGGSLGTIYSLAFSPNGSHLAAGGADGVVHVWKLDGYIEAAVLPGHAGGVLGLAFAPDGKNLAATSLGEEGPPRTFGTVKVWDWAAKKMKVLLEGHQGGVWSVAFSPDGKTLVTAGETAGGAGEVKLWETSSWQLRIELADCVEGVRALAFARDNRTLAVAGAGPLITLWNVAGLPQIEARLRSPSPDIAGLAFAPDGKTLATAGGDGNVQLWAPVQAQGGPLLVGHTRAVRSLAFFKGPKEQTFLATAAGDPGGRAGEVKIWLSATGQEEATLLKTALRAAVLHVAVDGQGKLLATAGAETTVQIDDLTTGRSVFTMRTGHADRVESLAFAPHDDVLATGSWDASILLWNTRKGAQIKSLAGHMGHVLAVAFSPDGNLLAAGGANHQVRIWEVATRTDPPLLKGHTGPVTAVAFSPNSRYLATGSADRMVKVWDVNSGKDLLTLRGAGLEVTSVAFSPDGKTLASGSRDGTVRLWDAETGYQRGIFPEHHGAVFAVAFSADGQALAAAHADQTVKVWLAAKDTQ